MPFYEETSDGNDALLRLLASDARPRRQDPEELAQRKWQEGLAQQQQLIHDARLRREQEQYELVIAVSIAIVVLFVAVALLRKFGFGRRLCEAALNLAAFGLRTSRRLSAKAQGIGDEVRRRAE